MTVNYKEQIPKDFIESNNTYVLSRCECYESWFKPELVNFLESDKTFVSFLLDDCTKMIELSKQNSIYARNHLKYMRKVHRNGLLINPHYDIESQVDYLTEGDQEFLEEILDTERQLIELHEKLAFYSEANDNPDEKFDWRKALEKEKTYKQHGNVRGLLNTCFDFWNKFGAGHTFQDRFPKICYYSGRLHLIDELKAFLEKNEMEILMWIDDELRELGQKLLEIGVKYPNLDNEDYRTIDDLYTNPKYYDLLEDILFDQEKLAKPLRKFDASVREIRQESFTNDLKEEIFSSFLHNCNVESFDFDEVYYYDRSSNRVVKKFYDEDIIQGVHFYIDFPLDLEKFSAYVKDILGSEFFQIYSNSMLDDNEEFENAKYYKFNDSTWEIFMQRLSDFSKANHVPSNSEELIKQRIVEDWLESVNKA